MNTDSIEQILNESSYHLNPYIPLNEGANIER